eukprot:g4042.t1
MASEHYTKENKTKAMETVTKNGFPPLSVFKEKVFNPNLLETFIKKEVLLKSPDAALFLSPSDIQVIYLVVSAANNCEMCLSFHAANLLTSGGAKQADVDRLMEGGLPEDPKIRAVAIAAKYAIAHKGISVGREQEHLKTLGISDEMYTEIVFWAGQMVANNYLFVHLINSGCDVEDMLKQIGPFRETVYKKEST